MVRLQASAITNRWSVKSIFGAFHFRMKVQLRERSVNTRGMFAAPGAFILAIIERRRGNFRPVDGNNLHPHDLKRKIYK